MQDKAGNSQLDDPHDYQEEKTKVLATAKSYFEFAESYIQNGSKGIGIRQTPSPSIQVLGETPRWLKAGITEEYMLEYIDGGAEQFGQ